MNIWLPTGIFSALAGISERNVQKACKASLNGKLWNGFHLNVRHVPGVGGEAGKQYEVQLSSLPRQMQDRYLSVHGASETARRTDEKASRDRDFKYSVIRPLLEMQRNQIGRGALVEEIAAREHLTPDGEFKSFTTITIYAWLRAYERGGIAALSRKVDKRRGTKISLICYGWDRSVDLPHDVKVRLANDLRDYVRGLHRNKESRGIIITKASRVLLDWTREAGFDATPEICKVSETFVRKESRFRKVGEFEKDRKAYEDKRPRIRRAAGLVEPMEIVFGDVHHLDFILTRVPGFAPYPKAVSWLDMATNRIWMDIYMLPDRKGIRNEHVIDSFIRMCTAWGGPKHLYLDNGSEYNWADFISDAMKLIREDGRYGLERIDRFDRESGVIRAKPYNAPAKTIEGVFGRLETHHFQTLPGWIGGDRTNKPTANLGKLPEPFPGTFDDFKDAINAALKLYHFQEQTRDQGNLKGSPMALYQRAIEAGWSMTAIDPDAWAVAFSEEEVKKVTQGAISHKGLWTCRELQGYAGDRVIALIPKYSAWNRLPLKDEGGNLLGFAERDIAFHPLDIAGSIESDARARAQKETIRFLASQTPKIDPVADNARHAASLPDDPVAPVGATVTASPEAKEIAAGLAESPVVRLNRQIEAGLKENQDALAVDEKFRKLREKNKWAS